MLPKPDFCQHCPINHLTTGYVPLKYVKGSKTLLLGEASGETEADKGEPFVGGAGSWLNNLLFGAKIDRKKVSLVNTLGCRPPDNVYPLDRKWTYTNREDARQAVAYCAEHHLWPAINEVNPDKLIALGDYALSAVTNRRGIMVWRGSPLPLRGDDSRCRVMPTFHPAYLMRDAKYASQVIGDMQKSLVPPPEYYNLQATHADIERFSALHFAFDFEWDEYGAITLCGLTDKLYTAIVSSWDNHLFKPVFERATDLIGHNIIGADTRHFERLGWNVTARMHDTMLKQHLVQPDYRHGLGPVSSYFLNKPFWKGRGKEEEDADGNIIEIKSQYRTWDQPDAIPRELGGYGGCSSLDEAYRLYNARDTDASFQLNPHLDYLLAKWKLEHVYWNVSLPMGYICRDIADKGIRIDSAKVAEVREELTIEIAQVEQTLPDGLRPYEKPVTKQIPAPPGTFKAKESICKGTKKAPHTPVTLAFTIPTVGVVCVECGKEYKGRKLILVKRMKIPSTKRITPWNSSPQVTAYAKQLGLKGYINRKRKTEAADVNARKVWGREHPEFRIIDRLKDLNTERNNFFKAGMQGIDRLYFDLLVHGTSEGRLSSHGHRHGIDPNIQNQPESVRKIYIPDKPTYAFIELDYAQGENMLTAHLAQDWERLERLRTPGYSEHLDLARRLFNLPTLSKEQAKHYKSTPEANEIDVYDIGKHINHGSNYGMTHVKLREYLEQNNYFYTEADCKEFMAIGKALNPQTTRWQNQTIEIARRDGYLRNAFGRIRWFSTRDIATKSLAFLPASTLADIILRAMIAHFPVRFAQQISALGLQRTCEFLETWFINIQIHDSLVLQGHASGSLAQAERTRAVMTQPWKELEGFALGVDVKIGEAGQSWGDIKQYVM